MTKDEQEHLLEEIQAILEKACAKEASARYNSAKEMRVEVEEVLRNKVEVPREKSQSETEKKNVPHNDKIETKKIDESDQKVKHNGFQTRKIFVGVLGLILVVLFYFTKDFIFNEEDIIVSIPSGKTFTNSIGMEFIEIPAGEFVMGCSKGDSECYKDEKPRHRVKITKPFFLGKFEVTQGQWMAVMGANPSEFENCGINCPVDSVSWNEVKKFINKLCIKERLNYCNYRLPTEAQWEYAARAGSKTKYYWGNEVNYDASWYIGNSKESTHPVGQLTPNHWGLYDIIGNVWEWTEDNYDFYKDIPQIDPKVLVIISNDYRVIRGGSSFYCNSPCRVSVRFMGNPEYSSEKAGFRLVLQP
jgi:formylglycine-generating enzyme required for sulfatase activity